LRPPTQCRLCNVADDAASRLRFADDAAAYLAAAGAGQGPVSTARTPEDLAARFGLGALSEEEVRAVKAPTLIVWGKYDELANPAGADRLERTIPGAKKVIVDDCGHMPQLEKAAEFNRIVRDFLKGDAKATDR
jgi:pimeloyl-ACP methyl ester carboxylesterase